jgi:hypothetical protein
VAEVDKSTIGGELKKAVLIRDCFRQAVNTLPNSQHKEMNNEQALKDTNSADPDYKDWLSYCKAIATDAKFRGLLKSYFAGHPLEDYPALAIGAQEILSHVVDGLLEENQDEDVCVDCRLANLIYPPA